VRVFTFAVAAPSLAGAANITCFNIGIMAGPALTGLLITYRGLPVLGWACAGLAVAGLIAAYVAYLTRAGDTPAEDTPHDHDSVGARRAAGRLMPD
jgi:DHA1 family chloramphenicol resistance protein-like MFS transporter